MSRDGNYCDNALNVRSLASFEDLISNRKSETSAGRASHREKLRLITPKPVSIEPGL